MDSQRFDRLARTISSRRGVIGGLVAGSLASVLALATGGDAVDAKRGKKKSCPPSKKRCGRRCIPKRSLCCPRSKKTCGKQCIPKQLPCCTAGQKVCGAQCIPSSACCTHADCGDLFLCAGGTCVIGQGVCPTNADVCTAGSGETDCGTDSNGCNCFRTTTGQTRCADFRHLPPGDNACINDAQCAARHPTIPGVFCARGGSAGGGGGVGQCPGPLHCFAPCPG